MIASKSSGVPKGSILILFLLYVNDLRRGSNILTPIMFADDTNLFFNSKPIWLKFLQMEFLSSFIV